MKFVYISSILLILQIQVNAAYLDVNLKEYPSAASASEMTFDDYATATQAAPWVLADKYIEIQFDLYSDWTWWGIRIVTDNYTDIVSTSGDTVVPFQDASGNNYYGGLINVVTDGSGNITDVTDSSYYRALLAWQVFDVEQASITAPTDSDIATEWWEDESSGGSWAYIGDKSDYAYDENEVYWISGGNTVFNYDLIVYGLGPYMVGLIPHPGTDTGVFDDDGDSYYDVYVYLSARFWNTAYSDTDGDDTYETATDFQLPAGEYNTTLYVEYYSE